jgi:hypothetical protein
MNTFSDFSEGSDNFRKGGVEGQGICGSWISMISITVCYIVKKSGPMS